MNERFKEIHVTIESVYPLAGTLAVPAAQAEPFPAVLIVPGTGKSDRDGNGGGLNMNLYKQLAHRISELGFVTLRYDKRGTHASGGDYYKTGLWDLVDDAEACVRFLQSRPEVDAGRIIILGHSEGCFIAPAVHSRRPVQGLILLSGAAGPMDEILRRQGEMAIRELEASTGFKGFLVRLLNIPNKAKKQTDEVFEKIRRTTTDTVRIKGAKVNAKWFREYFDYDVFEHLRRVTCPTLAVTGSNDIQVEPEHAKVIAEAVNGEAEWHIIPQMNHILRKFAKPHTMLGLKKEYKSLLDQPIDSRLIALIADWLRKHFPRP